MDDLIRRIDAEADRNARLRDELDPASQEWSERNGKVLALVWSRTILRQAKRRMAEREPA